LLVGLAYPLIAAPPLSRLVARRSTKSFVVTFFVTFMVAVALMAVVLKTVDGLVGGYGAGFLAIWFFGAAMTHFLNSDSHFLRIGALLACWTFLGDFFGYNAREYIAGAGGVIAYASIYALFFGSGLGTLLHHVQKDDHQL
jgi:predicted Na+-dependent transporter